MSTGFAKRCRASRSATWIGLLSIVLAGGCLGGPQADNPWLRGLEAFGPVRIAADTIQSGDTEVARLLRTLDSLLALPTTSANSERDARNYLRAFTTYLEMGLLTREQTDLVLSHVDEIAQMLERYKDERVVLLGVNNDDNLETIQSAKEREGLEYRTWWDGSAPGPIASSWKVWGWPDIFVLDENGVILHADKRGDRLIDAVDAVLARRRGPGGEGVLPPPS